MLKKQLTAVLAMMGAMLPFAVQADQPMSGTQTNQGSSYNSGEMVREGQLPGGYNQSASYKCDEGWDVFLTGDYIFWDWTQDTGMGVGIKTPGTITSLTDVTLQPDSITPGYASGFQVGLGFNMKGMDDWNFYGEYTWYKNNGSKTSGVSADITSPSIAVDYNLDTDISLRYSNADFLLQRPFYFGKKLTANFYSGLKALWITNKTNVNFNDSASFSFVSPDLINGTLSAFSFNNKVSSWALGPKFGLDANWLVGCGFKILSNISLSALYTRYTQNLSVATDGDLSVLDSFTVPLTSSSTEKQSNYGTIRPVLETFLGLSWGSFFGDTDTFHFDLSVGYDFNIFWDYVTAVPGMTDSSNMYLHGLNIQARFDF